MNGELNMKFQVSLFGDFSLLTPTEDNIKKCIEAFFSKGLLPGNFQEFDARSNKMEPRLSLQSMRNGITINVASNRVDFLANPLPGTPAASLTLRSFFDEVVVISKLLGETFGLTFKRIGVVSEKFFKEMSVQQIEEARKKFVNDSFNVLQEQNVTEWNVRNIILKTFPEPVDQDVNVIYNLGKVKVQIADANGHNEYDTLLLSVDINTAAEKKLSSLSNESISYFVDESLNIEKTLNERLSGVIYGAD